MAAASAMAEVERLNDGSGNFDPVSAILGSVREMWGPTAGYRGKLTNKPRRNLTDTDPMSSLRPVPIWGYTWEPGSSASGAGGAHRGSPVEQLPGRGTRGLVRQVTAP
jgi:hypothetical protein